MQVSPRALKRWRGEGRGFGCRGEVPKRGVSSLDIVPGLNSDLDQWPGSDLALAGVEVLDGRLYAVGGKDERGNKLRSVERYDPR